MGISISHGVPSTRSALTIENLGKQLAHSLTGSEWREVAYLFDGKLYTPIHTPPAQASRVSALLSKAAASRAMDGDWAQLATLLAGAASRAAQAGEHWVWD